MFPDKTIPKRPGQPGRFQLPQKDKGAYYFTPELEAEFRKRYPTTFNAELMELFGVSFSTLHRLASQIGVTKNIKVIQRKQAAVIKKKCEANGYYDSLRGHRPSDACIEGARRAREEGFHPMKALKRKNPRKYKRIIEKRRQARLEFEREIERYKRWGVDHPSALAAYRPQIKFTKRQLQRRSQAIKLGYILGDKRDNSGERYNVYYNEETNRSLKFEQKLELDHFRVLALND